MQIINEIGPAAIRSWTERLSDLLIEGARTHGVEHFGPKDPTQKTPITAFLCPGDAHEAENKLRDRGVIASARGPVVRLAPHFYSTEDDVNAALTALAEVFRSMGSGK